MGFLDIMGLRYNTGITYVNIFNDGRFNSSMWVLPKFVLVYVVMGIPSHNIDFKGAMYVLHFGFLFNDECLENYKFS
jgi:hypothetical protein